MNGLLRSRKFWLAVAGVVQTIVSHYFDVPPEIWGSVDALIAVLIGAIAHEDAAQKQTIKPQ